MIIKLRIELKNAEEQRSGITWIVSKQANRVYSPLEIWTLLSAIVTLRDLLKLVSHHHRIHIITNFVAIITA
jgi:hypothetical protein